MASNKKLRSLELFAGAGGLALGTARAGFKHVAVIERHGPACETLRQNKKNEVEHVREWDIIETDVTELDFSKYAGLDLLSGGPPCQPFSLGGKRSGRLDKRDMFPHFIRAVRECQPKSFLIENVKGLWSGSFFNYFNYILEQLRFPQEKRKSGEKWKEHRSRLERIHTRGKYGNVQYNVIPQILKACDFGAAQRRERVFIVGVRSDLEIEYSFPLPTHTRESLWIDQWLTGEYWERHNISRPTMPSGYAKTLLQVKDIPPRAPWRTVRDEISNLPAIASDAASQKVINHFLNPGARSYTGHTGSILDAPSKTIKAGYHGVPGGENMIRLDDGSVRYFSVRECARLQGFPDNWQFIGAWCNCMRQIGNAVPVTLAEAVAEPLAKSIRAREEFGAKSSSTDNNRANQRPLTKECSQIRITL